MVRISRAWFVVVVSLASGAALAEQPRTPVPTPAPSTSMRPQLAASLSSMDCGAVPADITVKLTSSGVEQFSQGYGHPPTCTAFVVDFSVDHSVGAVADYYQPALVLDGRDTVREDRIEGTLGKFEYYAKVSKEVCATHSHEIVVYRKKAGETAFAKIGGGSLHPTWNEKGIGFGPVCMLAPSAGFQMVPLVTPPASGVDQYRVAIRVGGAPGQLSVSATHPRK